MSKSKKRRKRQPAARDRVPGQPPDGSELTLDSDRMPMSLSDEETRFLLTRAADEVRGLANRMDLVGSSGNPSHGNPWRDAIPALLQDRGTDTETLELILGTNGEQSVGRSQTFWLTQSARDHLYGIANCLPSPALVSVMSLCRVTWEAASTATWLNHAGQEPDEILRRSVWLAHRHMDDYIKSCTELLAWPASSDHVRDEVSEETASLKANAKMLRAALHRLGMTTSVIKKGPSASERLAEMMGVLRNANPELRLQPDRAMYSRLSGALHGDPNTLIGLLDRSAQGPIEGAMTVSVRSRLGPVLWHAVVPVTMMIKTVDHWWDSGLDVEGVDAHARNLIGIIHESASGS